MSLCHSTSSVINVYRRHKFFHIFDFSERDKRIWRNLTGGKYSTSSTTFVFCPDSCGRLAALVSDWLRDFSTFLLQPLNWFWWNLTRSKYSTSSTMLVFSGRSVYKDYHTGFSLTEFSSTAVWILMKLGRKQVSNVLYQLCVFRTDMST